MSFSLLVVVTAIYTWISIDQATGGHWSMAIVFAGYALANIGLLVAVK